MGRLLVILFAMTVPPLALAGCDFSDGQMAGASDPQAQRVRRLEADLTVEQDKNAQLTKRCEQLTDELAKVRRREQQLSLQLQAIGDAPRQRDILRSQTWALAAQVETLRGQIVALGGTPPPLEPLPALPPLASAPATAPGASAFPARPPSRPASAPAGTSAAASPPAAPRPIAPPPPEDVAPTSQESR